ncbi:MAG: hypothetical protein M3P82_04390, partial [Bacteroidota bacterium]|nr:hypothetical protein [Bacteroidota bacterium]
NGAARIIDSLGIQTASKITGNRSLIPGLTDAVYIPVSSSAELSNIIPRFYSENLNLPVLGTGEWNNAKTLIENRMYIKQLYFDSDFYINDVSGKDFTNLDEADIKNYYFGYDGIKLILSRISEGNTTRNELNDALGNVNDHKATHNNITIKNRTNHLMSIMSFSNGKLKKVKDFVY